MNKDVLALAVVLISWAVLWGVCLFKQFPSSIAQTSSVFLLKSPAFYSLNVPPFFSSVLHGQLSWFGNSAEVSAATEMHQTLMISLDDIWKSVSQSGTLWIVFPLRWGKKTTLQPIHKSKSLEFLHQQYILNIKDLACLNISRMHNLPPDILCSPSLGNRTTEIQSQVYLHRETC